MSEIFHQIFELHRNQRLVFDDEDAGRALAVDFLDRFLHQPADIGFVHFHDLGRFLVGEILQRGQQQRLTADRSRRRQAGLRGAIVTLRSLIFAGLDIGARPNLVEGAVERHAPAAQGFAQSLVRQGGFQRGAHKRVPGGLRTGQGAGIAAQIRQVCGNFFANRHIG